MTGSVLCRASAVAVATAFAAGCGGGEQRHSSQAPPAGPAAVRYCPAGGQSWRGLTVNAGRATLRAAVRGAGDAGVVFANQSGNSPCEWLDLAGELAARGVQSMVFEYADLGHAAAELLASAEALRRRGAERIAVVGASLGGRAVVEAAARDRGRLAAGVSLSAERAIGPYPEILPDARRARIPLLYVGSRQDSYTNAGRDTRQLHAATPDALGRLLLVPGPGHGTQLLAQPKVRKAVLEFLTERLGTGPAR